MQDYVPTNEDRQVTLKTEMSSPTSSLYTGFDPLDMFIEIRGACHRVVAHVFMQPCVETTCAHVRMCVQTMCAYVHQYALTACSWVRHMPHCIKGEKCAICDVATLTYRTGTCSSATIQCLAQPGCLKSQFLDGASATAKVMQCFTSLCCHHRVAFAHCELLATYSMRPRVLVAAAVTGQV